MKIFDTSTNLYFIIGNPVCHSKSPFIHNTLFEKYNINAIYLAFQIDNSEILKSFINGIKNINNIKGFNVTIPYKVDIIELLDEIDSKAKDIGSVNTVCRVDNKLIGYNTDWLGVIKTLENNQIKKDAKTLIIGAGGATNGVIYALKQFGINEISITNRTKENGVKLANKFKINFLDYEEYKKNIKNFDFIINTTSISFKELLENYQEKTKYFDLKYYLENEPDFIINGKDMLIEQAFQAFKIWTGIYPELKLNL